METMQYIRLLESSLSKVWWQINENRDFAIISAYTEDNTPEDNLYHHARLKTELEVSGQWTIELRSLFTLNHSELQEERSFFILRIMFYQAASLASTYRQNAFLYKNEKEFLLIQPNGNILRSFFEQTRNRMSYNPALLRKAYAELIKRRFKTSSKRYAFNSLQELTFFRPVEDTHARMERRYSRTEWKDIA
jgi:hypothetical protein